VWSDDIPSTITDKTIALTVPFLVKPVTFDETNDKPRGVFAANAKARQNLPNFAFR
jgi:hypothetical protein